MPAKEAPIKISPKTAGDYLDVMSKAIFQTGMSWRVVESKWKTTREAFHGFNPQTVASLSPLELDELTQDTRIIRNRRKIEAIVANARRMVELEKEHGSFQKYLRSHGDFEPTVASLRKEFKFLGEMGCYYFLYVVGEDVPSHEEWTASRQR